MRYLDSLGGGFKEVRDWATFGLLSTLGKFWWPGRYEPHLSSLFIFNQRGKTAIITVINRDTMSTGIWMSYSRDKQKNRQQPEAIMFSFFPQLFLFLQSKQINLGLANANGWCFYAQLERVSHPCYGVITVTFALAQAQDKSVRAWPGTGLSDTPVIETRRQWVQQVVCGLLLEQKASLEIVLHH